MDNDCRTRWEQLVKIHFETKAIVLRAEESLELENQTYIQPIREERDAFEHVCRGVYSYLGKGKNPHDGEYLAACFEAARKHAVRAFFDAADWYGQVLREAIIGRLKPYSHQCIRTVLPDYYPVTRQRIDNIAEAIIACREEKDASDEAGTYQEVATYREVLRELETIFRGVRDAAPTLEEVHEEEHSRQLAERQQQHRNRLAERPWSLVIGIVAGLVAAGIIASLSYWLGSVHSR